jgi:hypothetical protein
MDVGSVICVKKLQDEIVPEVMKKDERGFTSVTVMENQRLFRKKVK